jgi:hypothetical protein
LLRHWITAGGAETGGGVTKTQEIISLALSMASSIKAQNRIAKVESETHMTTVPNWEFLVKLSQQVYDANEARVLNREE